MPLTDAEVQALRDKLDAAEQRNRVFEASQNRILAVATVGTLVREAGFSVKQTLLDRVCESPKMTADGKVDPIWAKAVADDLVTVGEGSGHVEGLGEQHMGVHEGGRKKMTDEEASKAFGESLKELGVSEAGLKYAMGKY